MPKKSDGYEVGYGNPPKHSQFPPGVSGNKGRRKRPETQAEIVARIRDEKVMLGDRLVTKFELAIQQSFNQTIRSGKPRDLKLLLELLEKHGSVPEADQWAEMQEGAERAQQRILSFFNKVNDIDPADVAELERLEREEAELIMSCPHCAPELKAQWKRQERKALADRYGKTGLHRQVETARTARPSQE